MYKVFARKTKGYFTVEASMIIPLVVVLLGLIFYLTFYMYDRCVISQDAYIQAFRGTLYCGKESEDIEHKIRSETHDLYGKKYVGVEHLESDLRVERNSVTVEAVGIMAATHWKFTVQKEAERICPVDFIRKVRLAQKLKNTINANIEEENGNG